MSRRSELSELVQQAGPMRSSTLRKMHENEKRVGGIFNKKLERSLRSAMRQQGEISIAEEVQLEVDPPVMLVEAPLVQGEEETIATMKDWEWRMVHQEIRLAQVKHEANRRNLPVPEGWVAYEARISRGTPPPPQSITTS